MAAPFPPSPDPAAAVALRTVQALLAEGHAVDVVSPLPSAAGRSGPLAGLRGALAVARAARDYDELRLQVGRGLLFRPDEPQARRVVDSAVLALALRLWRRTVADVGDMSDVPGGGGGLSGRLVWGAVDEILVSSEPVRNHVTKVLHMPLAKVKVKPAAEGSAGGPVEHPVMPPPAELPAWRPDGWAGLMAQVQERAAAERARRQR